MTGDFERTFDKYVELYKNGGYIREMRKHVGHAPILTCACGVIIENSLGEILLREVLRRCHRSRMGSMEPLSACSTGISIAMMWFTPVKGP